MNDQNKLYDIVFVCGIYKSGTSLLTSLLEKIGYSNPAMVNNPSQQGQGLTQRYSIKECIITRQINNDFLRNLAVEKLDRVLIPLSPLDFTDRSLYAIIHFLLQLDSPTVLKDPKFTYTLHYWIDMCKMMNKKCMVYFTYRDEKDINEAWNTAYITRKLLKQNKYCYKNMFIMQNYQKHLCIEKNIPLQIMDFSFLKEMLNWRRTSMLEKKNIINRGDLIRNGS